MKYASSWLLLALASQLPQASVHAQSTDGKAVRCISLARIDDTEIIDNRTIVFYLRNHDIYVNRLERACPQLKPDRPFGYTTTSGMICRLDSITVFVDYGAGLRRGAACTLSEFEPANEDVIAVLKAPDNEPSLVTVRPLEDEEPETPPEVPAEAAPNAPPAEAP